VVQNIPVLLDSLRESGIEYNTACATSTNNPYIQRQRERGERIDKAIAYSLHPRVAVAIWGLRIERHVGRHGIIVCRLRGMSLCLGLSLCRIHLPLHRLLHSLSLHRLPRHKHRYRLAVLLMGLLGLWLRVRLWRTLVCCCW